MAEAEDLITDAARHATIFARDLWRRHRPPSCTPSVALADVTQRLHLLLAAVFGSAPPIRAAQRPMPATLLQRLANRHRGPFCEQAVPATDGDVIWLPAELPLADPALLLERYRVLALQQAMRASRGGVLLATPLAPLARDLFLILEAAASDLALVRLLPGTKAPLDGLRRAALARRPPLQAFPLRRQPLESLVRAILGTDCDQSPPGLLLAQAPAELLSQVPGLTGKLVPDLGSGQQSAFLYRDLWTGEFRPRAAERTVLQSSGNAGDDMENPAPPRSARLDRRPQVRESMSDESDERQGAWMVQTAQPHEHAEDPIGMQRPTDRDEKTAAEEFADSLSELPEARLIATPGRPKEILLSDEIFPPKSGAPLEAPAGEGGRLAYPEWDYRLGAYREPGATVRLWRAQPGPQAWVTAVLQENQAMLQAIRRRFEMLRACRLRLRKQLDGDDIDLDTYIDGHADFRAGQPLPEALYQSIRPARRDLALSLLIDVSGSTDGWISEHRRVIDVEREALLLVCIALDSLAQPYSVLAFSGEGPGNVSLRTLKDFDEPYGGEVARRIAGLEPEHYTRAGAAIRHATATLMQQPARHRLLLLLSDGKPNDIDQYDGRYGLEDMRQAVIEARLQGISLFCLTIDRQAAAYLPRIFGPRHYALLPKPQLLPTVLLEWMKRLVTT